MKKLQNIITLCFFLIITFLDLHAQNITGSGNMDVILKFTTTGSIAGNSIIQESSSKIGIGISPAFKLDVDGDINIPASKAYYLGGITFLTGNSGGRSVTLGFSNGLSGSDNTYIGWLAGQNDIGTANTYIGSYVQSTGGFTGDSYQNTAVGYAALSQTNAYGGCAFGYRAAHDNNSGCSIVAIGEDALNKNTTGNDNTALGHDAGESNETGQRNTFLGAHTDVTSTALNNATAIGEGATVHNSYEIVIGNDSEYVGIGYSNEASYPEGKLSVDESVDGKIDMPTIAGYFHNGDTVLEASSAYDKRAIYSISEGPFSNGHSGGWFLNNIGGDFIARNSSVGSIAVRGRAGYLESEFFNVRSVGGWFEANNADADNIGV